MVLCLCDTFGLQKVFSSAYYPQGDGFAERFMRTLNNSLSVLCRADPTHWHDFLPSTTQPWHFLAAQSDWDFLPGLQFACNSAKHEATHLSPFEMVSGKLPRSPRKVAGSPCVTTSEMRYARRLRFVIANHHKRASLALGKYWTRMKLAFDKHRRDVQLSPGQLVLVWLSDHERHSFGSSRKLTPKWSKPMEVLRVL